MNITKSAILITAYCGGDTKDIKRHMTKTICQQIKQQNPELFICLVSHSTHDEATQENCDVFVYDKDNSFQIDGFPEHRLNNHGVAELRSIYLGVEVLKKKGFTHFLKLCYDNNPDLDFARLIEACENTNKELVTAKWYEEGSLGTNVFFSSIDFFEKTLGPDIIPLLEYNIENVWNHSVRTKGLINDVFLIEDYSNFLTFEIKHFSHYGGTQIETELYKSKYKMNELFELEYKLACLSDTDINEHLPELYELAKECTHVTEMGVRTGQSTRAFLNTDVILRSYDLELNSGVQLLFDYAQQQGKNVQYTQANVLDIEIEETDLLFIDTYHVYAQLILELQNHAPKVRKYIAFHDTFTYGTVGEHQKLGLMPAIVEYMINHREWHFKLQKVNCNGLIVIEKI